MMRNFDHLYLKLSLEVFKIDPTQKPEPKPKVNRPENVFLFYVYRTDITRPKVIPEPIDNRKWEKLNLS